MFLIFFFFVIWHTEIKKPFILQKNSQCKTPIKLDIIKRDQLKSETLQQQSVEEEKVEDIHDAVEARVFAGDQFSPFARHPQHLLADAGQKNSMRQRKTELFFLKNKTNLCLN